MWYDFKKILTGGAMIIVVSLVIQLLLYKKMVVSLTTSPHTARDPQVHEESPDTLHNFVCIQEPCHLSIVFMGDSLTRFMYYSLAHYLRHNQWIEPDSYPHLVKPSDVLGGYELNFDWTPWYNASTLNLYPYETCDCHREPGTLRRQYNGIVNENRYFYDPQRNNTVVYFQAFTPKISIRGHFEDPKQALKQMPCKNHTIHPYNHLQGNVGDICTNITDKEKENILLEKVPITWEYDWPDAITHMVTKINPDVLVLNSGKWREPGWGFEQQSYLDKFAKAVKDANIPHTIWKTTTANKGGRIDPTLNEFDNKMCQQDWLECFNLTAWTSKVPSAMYVDSGHFREPVYRKMNELLLFDHLNITLHDDNVTTIPGLLGWEAFGIGN